MSLGTCYYALLKGYLAQREQRLNARFIADFWQHDSVQEMERQLAHLPPQEAYGRLTGAALAVAQLNRAEDRAVSCKLGSPDEYLLRAMRRAITQERVRLEQGLAFLASVGSAAPSSGCSAPSGASTTPCWPSVPPVRAVWTRSPAPWARR